MTNYSKIMRKITVLVMALAVVVSYSVLPMNQSYAASKKPAKVKGLTAKVQSTSAVKLTWKKAKNAKKYQVYVSTKKNKGFQKVATVKSSKKTYTVKKYNKKSLKAGTKYYFKVRAINGSKKGAFSKVVSAKTKAKAKPTPVPAPEPEPVKVNYVGLSDEEWAKLGTDSIAADDYIVDVRTETNYGISHLDGSVNVPVSNPFTEEQAAAIKAEYDKARGKRIVIICNSGNMLAKNAMAALQEKGADMSKITYLIGGAKVAWKMDGWTGKYSSMTTGSDEWVALGIDFAAMSFENDYILDVRSEANYKEGHFAGSVSFPVPSTYKEVDRDGIKAEYEKAADKRIVIICNSGNALARNAFQALAETGADMSKVTYLIGGAKGVSDEVKASDKWEK